MGPNESRALDRSSDLSYKWYSEQEPSRPEPVIFCIRPAESVDLLGDVIMNWLQIAMSSGNVSKEPTWT